MLTAAIAVVVMLLASIAAAQRRKQFNVRICTRCGAYLEQQYGEWVCCDCGRTQR